MHRNVSIPLPPPFLYPLAAQASTSQSSPRLSLPTYLPTKPPNYQSYISVSLSLKTSPLSILKKQPPNQSLTYPIGALYPFMPPNYSKPNKLKPKG